MYSILIAGGDMRQVMLARLLEQKGYDVYITGFDKMGIENRTPSKPDYVFLPVPYRTEDGSVKAPFAGGKLYLFDIVNAYPDSAYLLGGCDTAAKKLFGDNIRYMDLMQNEAYQVRNAMLTAQGAICAYLNNVDAALCDKACLVMGYGRISKFLCRLLRACGAEVTTAVRKDKDIELILMEGYRAARIKDLSKVLPEADVIFNTVPFHVLDEADMASINKGAKYIELASPPYGMDMELAIRNEVDVQIEPGIPGRLFPASAAKAILRAFEGEEK
jgi:dipicolinate synthase subunit A